MVRVTCTAPPPPPPPPPASKKHTACPSMLTTAPATSRGEAAVQAPAEGRASATPVHPNSNGAGGTTTCGGGTGVVAAAVVRRRLTASSASVRSSPTSSRPCSADAAAAEGCSVHGSEASEGSRCRCTRPRASEAAQTVRPAAAHVPRRGEQTSERVKGRVKGT